MTAILSQIFELLTVPPGNLTYHLVLAFSTAGALQAAVNNWRVSDYPQARRMMLGLALLLLTRLVLFGGAAFSWQGLTNDHLLMPPLDQALGLLSLVILIWLWAFPESVRGGDAASLLLGLVILTLATLNMVWWTRDGAELAYNTWLPNRIGSLVALVLLGAGVLLLLTRRPNNWGLGFGMFLALSAGRLAVLIFPQTAGDYSGMLRLAEMAAFPLLLALPQRFAPQTAAPLAGRAEPTQPSRRDRGVPALDQQAGSEALQAGLELSGETEPAQLAQSLARLIARAVVADICLILSPPDPQGQMACLGAYDLIRDEKLDPGALTSQALPVLSAALKRGLPLRLPASSTSPDLINLAQSLKLARTGPLLAAPVLARPADPLAGLALLTPYSNRSWTKDDQARLEQIAAGMARIFLRLEETLDREHEVREARLHLQIFG